MATAPKPRCHHLFQGWLGFWLISLADLAPSNPLSIHYVCFKIENKSYLWLRPFNGLWFHLEYLQPNFKDLHKCSPLSFLEFPPYFPLSVSHLATPPCPCASLLSHLFQGESCLSTFMHALVYPLLGMSFLNLCSWLEHFSARPPVNNPFKINHHYPL